MSLNLEQIYVILAVIGMFFGVLGTLLGTYLLIEVKSMQRSTHQIQYMPVDDAIDKENEEYLKSLNTDWATSEESLDNQRKLFREDIEESMPEFAPNEDDKETYAY